MSEIEQKPAREMQPWQVSATAVAIGAAVAPLSLLGTLPVLFRARTRANYWNPLLAVVIGVGGLYAVAGSAFYLAYAKSYAAAINTFAGTTLFAEGPAKDPVLPTLNPLVLILGTLVVGGIVAAVINYNAIKANPDIARTPFILATLIGKGGSTRLKKKVDNGSLKRDGSVLLGTKEDGGRLCPVWRDDLYVNTQGGREVYSSLLLGRMGVGKTALILRELFGAAQKGDPVLVVDMKGDGEVAAAAAAYAEKFGRPFYDFRLHDPRHPYVGPSAAGPAYYDPIGPHTNHNYTTRADFLMSLLPPTAPNGQVYDTAATAYARFMFGIDEALTIANGGVPLDMPGVGTDTLDHAAHLMDPNTLHRYFTHARMTLGDAAVLNALYDYDTLDAVEYDIKNHIHASATSSSGRRSFVEFLNVMRKSIAATYLFREPHTGGQLIDLRTIEAEGAIVVFSLPKDVAPKEAPAIGRLVLSDLAFYAGSAGPARGRLRMRVFIDEFQALKDEGIANLYARSRSAGVSLSLATQAMSDIDSVGENFRKAIFNNSGELIIFSADDMTVADIYAGYTGIERTGIIGADGKEVTVPRVAANEIMELVPLHPLRIMQSDQGPDRVQRVAIAPPPRIPIPEYTVDMSPYFKANRNPVDVVLDVPEEAEVDAPQPTPAPPAPAPAAMPNPYAVTVIKSDTTPPATSSDGETPTRPTRPVRPF